MRKFFIFVQHAIGQPNPLHWLLMEPEVSKRIIRSIAHMALVPFTDTLSSSSLLPMKIFCAEDEDTANSTWLRAAVALVTPDQWHATRDGQHMVAGSVSVQGGTRPCCMRRLGRTQSTHAIHLPHLYRKRGRYVCARVWWVRESKQRGVPHVCISPYIFSVHAMYVETI